MRVCVWSTIVLSALGWSACSGEVGEGPAGLGRAQGDGERSGGGHVTVLSGEFPTERDAGPAPTDAGRPCPPTNGTTDGVFAILDERDAGEPCPPPPPPPGRCWVTGGGQIEPEGAVGGAFGGNAKPFRDGTVDGEWNHVTFEGDHFHGDPDTIACFLVAGDPADPPSVEFNRIEFSGTGTWNGDPGFTFEVIVEDHGEPGRDDFYSIVVTDAGGAVVYSAENELDRGNLQIHPTNLGHP